MRLKYFFIIFTCFLQFSVLGQQAVTIIGKITNDRSQPIANADVLLKSSDSLSKIIAFSISNSQGQFRIRHNLKPNQFTLEVSSLGYINMSKHIQIKKAVLKLNIDFILEDRVEELEEIEIKADIGRVTIRNDTIKFNLEKLTDGTETVVEDLLKKLPGIVVEENGTVLFKGKKIKALLLDGDNLFDASYTLGSKNISAEHIQGIEAIQNFEDNPLLQGLSNNDDVAINLKFKPGLSLSGRTDIGYGYKNRYYTNTTGIAITKKIKGFSLFKYNNMGMRSSNRQFNALDHIANSQHEKQSLYSPNFIANSDRGFSSTRNSVKNNEVFGSFNILPKLSKIDEFRINLNFLNDKSIQVNQYTTVINTEGEPIVINQSDLTELRPRFFNAIAKYKRYLSQRTAIITQFNYSNSFNQQKQVGTRNGFDLGEELKLKDYFYANSTNFTKRINGKSAFSLDLNAAISEKPQSNLLLSGINFETNELAQGENNRQDLNVKKSSIHLTGNYFKIGKKENKLNIKTGIVYSSTELISKLFGVNNNVEFENDINYQIFIPKLSVDYFINLKNLSFRPSVLFQLYNYNHYGYDINENRKGSNLLTNISLGMNYEFNEIHKISIDLNSKNAPPEENYLYTNYILYKNRVLKKNKLNFDKLSNQNLNIGYSYHNLFKDLDFSFRYGYQKNKNAYLKSSVFEEQVTYVSNVLEDFGSKSNSWNASINQYIGVFKSSFSLSTAYRSTTYFNRLNNSEIRKNNSDQISYNLGISTGVIWKLKFTNNIGYYRSKFNIQNSSNYINRRLSNSSNLSFIPSERWKFEGQYNLQIPDLNNTKNKFNQLEATIFFENKKNNINYRLEGKNLLNQKRQNTITTSDIYTINSNSSIFERYFLLTASFRF